MAPLVVGTKRGRAYRSGWSVGARMAGPMQVRTKFTWPSLKKPTIKRFPPPFSVPNVNGIVDKEELLSQPWVKKMFPDGKYPKEWDELEVKDFDETWVKKKKFVPGPPPVFGDKFEGKTPHKRFLLNRFRDVIAHDVVLAIDSLSMPTKEWISIRQAVENDCNFKVFKTTNSLARRSLQKTEIESFGYLLSAGAMLWYSNSLKNLKPLFKFLKKQPAGKHTLLGGKVHGQLFNSEQLKDLQDFPDIDTIRGELAGIIGEPAQRVARNIGHHPNTLGRLLASHASPPEDAKEEDQ